MALTPDERIAELEAEREMINEKCRANAEHRNALKDEYDALVERRLQVQREINDILKAEIEKMQVER